MILLGCASCGTFASVPNVTGLARTRACRFCVSTDLAYADELLESEAIRFGVPEGLACPQCGHKTHFVGRVKGERRWYCPSCRWKGAITEEEPAAKAAMQVRDLQPGHVIDHKGSPKTVKKVEYSPGGGGRAYVEFEDGATHTFPAAHQVTPKTAYQGEKKTAANDHCHYCGEEIAYSGGDVGGGWQAVDEENDFAAQDCVESPDGHHHLLPVEEEKNAAKTASDDFGPGSGGASGMWQSLMQWLRGGGPKDEIPSWFPKRWLTPDEIRTRHWVHSGDVSMDFVSRLDKQAAPVLLEPGTEIYDYMISHGWKPGHEYPMHTGQPGRLMIPPGRTDDEFDVLPPAYVPEEWEREFAGDMVPVTVASIQHSGAGVLVPVRFNPKGDPWTFLNEQLGTVSVDHLEIQPDGTWAGVLIVPPDKESDAKALNRAASITAASGIFSTKDGTMVYGPTTPDAIEMAMASGRYASDAFYVGTIPDRHTEPSLRPEPMATTDPFADVKSRTPANLASKASEIADGIRATNPGVSVLEAHRIALKAIQRYPALVKEAWGYGSDVPDPSMTDEDRAQWRTYDQAITDWYQSLPLDRKQGFGYSAFNSWVRGAIDDGVVPEDALDLAYRARGPVDALDGGLMIAEGTPVAYVGLQTRGRAIGDEGIVMQSELDYAHVRWTTGTNEGMVQAVRNGDLVANGKLNPVLFESAVVDMPVETVFARRGSLGLFNAVNDDGHLHQLPAFAEEAIGLLAARLRQDPSVAEVLAQLDDDDAAEFVAVACRVALRDAFEDA